MSIILNCDSCGKRMGALEPSIIRDSKYLCRKCGNPDQPEIKNEPNAPVAGILGVPADIGDFGIFWWD